MIQDIDNTWDSYSTQQLAVVMASIPNETDMQNFLRDVMTEKEIFEISSRLEAARMLTTGEKYTEITKQTKLSSRTVARISDWLKNGNNGYTVALDVITSHHTHIQPARVK